MKPFNKKTLALLLCMFFAISAFSGGLLSSEKLLGGGQSYAVDAPAGRIESMEIGGDVIVGGELSVEGDLVVGDDPLDPPDADAPTDGDVSTDEEPVEEDPTEEANSVMRSMALADEASDDPTEEKEVGAFLVSGGKEGEDYELADISGRKVLQVKTNTPLTIKNKNVAAATAQTIEICPNIQADITLAGVNITGYAPFNLMTPTQCHITLADDTTNTLNASTNATAALHCGEGSTLIIDDSVLNRDSAGNMITPENGVIGADVTLMNGQKLKKGDPLSKLNSAKRGKLVASGGDSSAGIGTGPQENAGTMIFNGGDITAKCSYGSGECAQGGGSGIGTGAGKVRGSPDMGPKGGLMIFNSAKIDATGAYHGAGIGAGWSAGNTNTRQRGAAQTEVSTAATGTGNCGDIVINGGYLKSTGGGHGNAFGAACGTTAKGCTIKVTGGTLLPVSNSSYKDLGGAGGHVVISGGSVRCASTNKFQGIGDTAWGSEDYTNEKNKVFMTKVNLSAEGITDDYVYGWELLIGGEKYDYGSPGRFDDGNLYLWLPSTAVGKEITVKLGVEDKDGKPKPVDPLFIPKVEEGKTPTLKRYIDFDLPEKWTKTLSKKYDGIAFESYDWENDPITTDEEIAKTLSDSTKVKIKVQRYDKKDGEAIEPEQEMAGNNVMPTDAGIYKLTVTSTQYAEGKFAESYWGHRATGWAIIEKVPSKVQATYAIEQNLDDPSDKLNYGKIKKVQLKATVQPGDGTKATCKAPTGLVQFYINGVKVGAPIDLSKTSADELTVTGNVCSITKTFDFEKDKYPAVPELDSGDFVVTAEYVQGTNYFENATKAQLVAWEDPDAAPGDNPKPPTLDEIVSKFPFINSPVPVITKDKDDLKDDEKVDGNKLVIVGSERIEPDPKNPDPNVDPDQPDTWPIHGFFKDRINEKVSKDKPKADVDYFVKLINDRYVFTSKAGYPLMEGTGDDRKPIQAAAEDIKVYDKDGNPIDLKTNPIDFSVPGKYVVSVTVTDENGNKCTIDINYNIIKPTILDPDINKDTNDDGIPDINIDTDDDGFPDINIDTDGDDKPDINIDTDGDGKPDVDIDTDGDGKPDINKDTDGDGKPDVDIDTNGDGKPDVNVDTNGDGKPDINKDTDGDGKPDVDIDTDGDGKPDINKDTDGDGKPDLDIDTNGDGKPDVNVDTNGDGKPDINKDTDGDGKPDVDIDTNGDGKPDINIDTNGDGKPDVNVDTNGDGKPDINIDTDGDGIPDINIDTDGDGIPDLNVDTDGDGKPDTNIDTDGDGKPDKNIKDPSEIKDILNENEPADTDELPWWIPRTGDTANMLTWLAVLGAAVLGLCGTVYGIRKKRS